MAKIVSFALLVVCVFQADARPRLQAGDVSEQVADIVKGAAQRVSDLVDRAVYQVELDLQDAGYGFGMQIFQINERYSKAIGDATTGITSSLQAASDSIDALPDDASSAAAKIVLSTIASAVSSAEDQIKPLYDDVLVKAAPVTKAAVNKIVSTNGSYKGADVESTVESLPGQVIPQIDSLRQAATDAVDDAVDDFLGL